MALKLFIDTNILIDFIEQRPFDIKNTNRLFLMAQNHETELYTSESVITTAFYITRLAEQIEKVLYLPSTAILKIKKMPFYIMAQ